MCGIVGAVAKRDVAQILLDGLKKLEYRGYDSAGLAIINETDHEIHRLRVLGKVDELAKSLQAHALPGHLGIAHTRWATHGQPSIVNAHPHESKNVVALVHNGIIENYQILREQLIKEGFQFSSETDTEVIAHLINKHLSSHKNMFSALRATAAELQGAYAIGIIYKEEPDNLYALRSGSPLVIGVGEGENFIASDPLALLPLTQRFIFLEEGDIARIERDHYTIEDQQGNTLKRKVYQSNASLDATSKGNYAHFMQKEIFEQPEALRNTMQGHIVNHHISIESFGHKASQLLPNIKRIQIVACGTSYHAGLVARYWLEKIARIPVRIEIASENRYRDYVVEPDGLFIALSQSGETADTLAAMRQAKKSGFRTTLAICNVPESTIAREADLLLLTRAGREIGVAATKSFTAQLVMLLMLAIVLGKHHGLSDEQTHAYTQALQALPDLTSAVLKLDNTIKTLSKNFMAKQHTLFLGRGTQYPIALEGALKLKEISYMHAEAYPAGELKHGPLALVENGMPIIINAPNDNLIDKLASNIQEVHARGGEIYIFADENIKWFDAPYTIIPMPTMPEILTPILYTLPLQLLAYHIAVLKGTDVDQPRNLAKSVTVE